MHATSKDQRSCMAASNLARRPCGVSTRARVVVKALSSSRNIVSHILPLSNILLTFARQHQQHCDMQSSSPNVAIVGGGLAGLALALALHQVGIQSTVFEARARPLDIGGAVMLSPNALKILDKLGVYDAVKSEGYEFRNLTWQTIDVFERERQEFGNKEKYGYDALRVHRYVLINALIEATRQAGVEIAFGKKFIAATERHHGVDVSFEDGTTLASSMLIGADGIHSTVRRLLYPDLTPKFINLVGVTAAVPTSALGLTEVMLQDLENTNLDYPLPITIQHPAHGAFVIAPQRTGAKEMFFGRQRSWTETDRAGWDARSADKQELADFLASNTQDFPRVVQDVVKSIPHDTINLWPFYVIPNLPSWISADGTGRIVLVGDAAHAIPPSAGQGVNQAFEDVYTLSLTVGALYSDAREAEALSARLQKWQQWRLERVKGVFELNGMIEARRTPTSERSAAQHVLVERRMDLSWLFGVDFESVVASWR
jgi:2-polyprenyl-6-methoxyphenol hydroxylase-like FAD-dependent oxidoreductase